MRGDSYQARVCKARATHILSKLMIEEPDEIDLDLIALECGNLRILHDGLTTCDGRLISGSNEGVIRVNASIIDEGRIRFIIAHELGHFVLHKAKSHLSRTREYTFWRKGSRESEANWFAGELLMPEQMLKPRLVGRTPSRNLFQGLKKEFRTSLLASCFQGVSLTREPSALVFSREGMVIWTKRSESFEFRLRTERVHSYTAAADIHRGAETSTEGLVDVPAGAWLPSFDPNGREVIQEDAWAIPNYGVVSILWLRDAI